MTEPYCPKCGKLVANAQREAAAAIDTANADCERMILAALAEAKRIVDTAEANADEFRRTHREHNERAYRFLEARGKGEVYLG